LKPKATVVLVVIVFLFGIITILPSNLAYAISSEKIPLVQQYEQFPGQKITGFCYVEWDEEQNLQWRIKVNGLVPETLGHFDLGHWAGEVDVPYAADDDGNADSKNQMVLKANVPYSVFSQFAKCTVHISGYTHFTSPVIALGISESNTANVEESKKITSTEKNSFLFYSLEYVVKILKNNTMGAFTGFNSVFGPPPPDNLSTGNNVTVSINVNEDAKEMSTGESLTKARINSTDNNPTVVAIEKGKSSGDKGASDKGASDKGASDKGASDKGDEPKKCNPGQKKNGLC
jgi:hypothetical protein